MPGSAPPRVIWETSDPGRAAALLWKNAGTYGLPRRQRGQRSVLFLGLGTLFGLAFFLLLQRGLPFPWGGIAGATAWVGMVALAVAGTIQSVGAVTEITRDRVLQRGPLVPSSWQAPVADVQSIQILARRDESQYFLRLLGRERILLRIEIPPALAHRMLAGTRP